MDSYKLKSEKAIFGEQKILFHIILKRLSHYIIEEFIKSFLTFIFNTLIT